MKKLLGILFLISSLPVLIQAQNNHKDEFGTNDPKAESILKKVSQKYKSYNSIRALFTLTITSPEDDVDEEQSGTVYLKDNKYKLELEDMEIICDNTTRWIHTMDPPEVQINNYEPDENPMENPAKIFTLYESDFLYQLAEEIKVDGKTVSVIELTPLNKDVDYFKIKLYIDMTDNAILKAQTFNKNGVRYLLEIKKLTPNLDLNDAFFTFDPKKYPDIEVVDLR